MNKQSYKCCPPKKKRKKKNCNVKNKKIGLMMLLLGVFTVFLLVLPLKYWVLLLSAALIVFGIMLLKKE
ncbi:MAG: hypothetical protein ACLT9U_05735 [Lentihominibacter sp.]